MGIAFVIAALISCQTTVKTPTYTGRVYDATMNNMTIITGNHDTVNISTMDADRSKVPGVLLNDSVRVNCEYKEVNGRKILTATALEILVHSPYYFIQGEWLEPNPIAPDQVQGFVLNSGGTASSVNMATLLIKTWNLDNYTLTLGYESIGNGQTFTGIDTLHVVRINADSLILSQDNRIVWRLARGKRK